MATSPMFSTLALDGEIEKFQNSMLETNTGDMNIVPYTDDVDDSESMVTENFAKLDFNNGLENFVLNTPAGDIDELAEAGITCDDGIMRIGYSQEYAEASNSANCGIESIDFGIPETLKGKAVYLMIDAATNMDNIQIDVEIDGVKTNGYIYGAAITEGDIENSILQSVFVADDQNNCITYNIPDNAEKISFLIQDANIVNGVFLIDNITFVVDDKGGIADRYMGFDGTIIGNYQRGDINGDSQYNICDLVRIDEYTNEPVNTKIYYAASKKNDTSDELLDVNDIRKGLLEYVS